MSPLARRTVPRLSFSTGSEGALRTWVSVREDKPRPTHPTDKFSNGSRVSGSNFPTGEAFFPVDLLGEVDKVMTGSPTVMTGSLVDASSIGNRVERPLIFRGNAESSINRDVGVLV